ncbi:unnamed protein product [Cunninghamella blakesleeana]
MFSFSWVVEEQTCGTCYIEMMADNDKEEITRSYEFNIDCDASSSSEEEGTNNTSQPNPSLPYYEEEEKEEEEEKHGSSIHQGATMTSNKEELNKETQEEPEEVEEPSEKKKLSLHNDHTKVAHISSHSDIDTVSDEPNMMTHRPPPSNHQVQHAKITHEKETQGNKNLLNGAVEKVKQLTSHKTDTKPKNEKGTSKPASDKTDTDQITDGQLEALSLAEFNPNADDKTLMEADKNAIEQEKLWIQQGNDKNPINHSTGPKKLILGGLLGEKTKKPTSHKSSSSKTSTTTTTTTTTHHSIPNTHKGIQQPPMEYPPSSSSSTNTSPVTGNNNKNPIHQQPPLSHEGQKIVDEHNKSVKEKQDELKKEIEEAQENAKEHPQESKEKIQKAQAEAQKDIQKLKLEEQEQLAKQQEKEGTSPATTTPTQLHSKHIKEAAQKNHSSHQKREAFRKVYSNRAKFAKAILQ